MTKITRARFIVEKSIGGKDTQYIIEMHKGGDWNITRNNILTFLNKHQ